jgi:hypothetical protein
MKTILIHLKAFGSDQMFVFTGFHGAIRCLANKIDVLEEIFRQCNHVDGNEWIAEKPYRSLSCGDDVIFLDGNTVERFHCDPAGWSKIEEKR